jgi:O-antigen/teichoic acid export membrane protein
MSIVRLSSTRLLARNVVLNLGGMAAPMLAALVAIPLLVAGLGVERFGFLTVAWVLIGYFSLFDLGLARALTKLVAEKLGSGDDEGIGPLAWTALLLMVALGAVGAVVLWLLSPWVVGSALKIPDALHREALLSMYLMAASLPMVIGTAGLRGILEANQSFGVVTALRVPLGVFTFLGPVAVLPFSTGLVAVTAVLVAGRVLAFFAHLIFCLRIFPQLSRQLTVDWKQVGALGRFGGWITVSNIVSPLMSYMDRFLIGALVSLSAVAYYVTPYELITKLSMVPSALLGVLFPALAATFAVDRERAVALFDRGIRVVFLVVFPFALVVITLANEGLDLWLGSEFAAQSTAVLQWLTLGILINSLAQVPFSALQSAGHPDVTGKLHLVELPLYGLAIVWLSGLYGIEGVAIAWVLRVSVDAVFLFAFMQRLLPAGSRIHRRLGVMAGVAILALAGGVAAPGPLVKTAYLVAVLAAFAWAAWFWILHPVERQALRLLRSRRGGPPRPASLAGADRT